MVDPNRGCGLPVIQRDATESACGSPEETRPAAPLAPAPRVLMGGGGWLRVMMALADADEEAARVADGCRRFHEDLQERREREAVSKMREEADTALAQGMVTGALGVASGVAQGVSAAVSLRETSAAADAERTKIAADERFKASEVATNPADARAKSPQATGLRKLAVDQKQVADALAVRAKCWTAAAAVLTGFKEGTGGVLAAEEKREEAERRALENDAHAAERAQRMFDEARKAAHESANRITGSLSQMIETRHQWAMAPFRA